jgi:hypothetical protein
VSDPRTYDEGQLPWLQAVEDEDEPRGLSARKMLVALLLVGLAALIVAGTFFWLGRREAGVSGPPELIAAPPGPYKVRPDDPGGLDVAGDSQTAFETSAGEDPDAQLDLTRLPPGAVPPAPKPETPEAAPTPTTETEPEPPATAASGTVIQLGAFKNPQQAERAWTALSTRFPAVAGLRKMLVQFPGGIRLRAAGATPGEAAAACRALKAAGESCFVAR